MFIEVKENVDVKNLTSFKIGGKVDKLYFPANQQDMVYLLKTLYNPIIMGNWSNVLISSAGIKGNVISTSKLDSVQVNEGRIIADCGVKGPKISKIASENGLGGFEFMSGFPGSIGGNIYMNASAHNQSISDFLLRVTVFDMEKKETLLIERKTLDFAYRSSILQRKPYILLSAEFKLQEQEKKQINSFISKILSFRKAYQPNLSTPNAGSVFKNPEDMSAGKLLDDSGVKKFSVGGAEIWKKHANFIVNTGDATSNDVLELMFMMYNAVKNKHGIRLEPEVKYFGEKTQREEDICNIMYKQK